MQALLVIVLPMLVSALSSVLGKSVSEFNALPRSERPAKLRAVLRSKWMWTTPPAAVAARALAATDAGVNAAVNALEKYGSGAVALGTEAAHAAAEKHLAKNPRSGGRMARVRIAPSIPTYALDRLDVTRARRNGHATPDTLTTLNVGDRFVIRDEDSPDRDSLPYTVTYRKFDDVKAETVTGGSVKLFADGATVAIQGGRGTRTVYSIRRVNGARRNGYSRRRNCGGDCACAPCQAAARSNPDPFAAVRRAIEKEVARFVESGGGFGQSKLMDAAYRVYEKHRIATGEQLPVEAVVAEINAARTRAEGLRREHNKRAAHAAEQAYRDEMRGRAAYMNPATRRNHHIRVGGTFYTPGGRRGTVLAEARGGYYRVRWSDGTLGSVQDSEMAAYPAEGSRANRGAARTNAGKGNFALVTHSGMNTRIVSRHATRDAAENAMKRWTGGYGSDSLMGQNYTIRDVSPGGNWEIIEIFGKQELRPRTRRNGDHADALQEDARKAGYFVATYSDKHLGGDGTIRYRFFSLPEMKNMVVSEREQDYFGPLYAVHTALGLAAAKKWLARAPTPRTRRPNGRR